MSNNAAAVAGDPAIRERELEQLLSNIVELTLHHLRRIPESLDELREVCGEWVQKFYELGGKDPLQEDSWAV